MTEWWRGSVTYQVYPAVFQDDNGDGVGDLKGITRRLDHIADQLRCGVAVAVLHLTHAGYGRRRGRLHRC